jgi:MFS superfamily sulfate permease-like transporter
MRVESGADLGGVILSMEGVDFIDSERADVLKKVAKAGVDFEIDFHLARVKPQVLHVLRRNGLFELVALDHVHGDIAPAVARYTELHPGPSTR